MYRDIGEGSTGGAASSPDPSGDSEVTELAHVPVYLVIPLNNLERIIPLGADSVPVTINGMTAELVSIVPVVKSS